MKRISIFTLIGANNIGAFLQGFALSKTLESLGFDYEFVMMPTQGEHKGKFDKIKRYLRQKNFRLLLYKIVSGKKYTQARQNLKTTIFDPTRKYDFVIIGSDEMWNLDTESFVQYPQFFGKNLLADKIISYAPSAGNTTYEQLKAAGYDFVAFDKISVRDQRTYELVLAMDIRKPVKVLDPTFLLESYDKYLPDIQYHGNYILVYSYGVYGNEVKKIKEFSKEINLPLLSIGTFNSWCDKNIIVSPFEFLAYMKKARFVITSTFHGTALSIILNKQFVSCVEGSEKVQSLLNEFYLQTRAVIAEKSLSEIFGCRIDYGVVNKMVTDKRSESMKYLVEALGEN